MIQVTPHMRILVAREPLDLRKGIDGTAAVCRQVLAEEPMSGTLFVFRNRARTMVRILVYDGQGFWLMTKRLSQGRFRHWCSSGSKSGESAAAYQLVSLLAGGEWTKATASDAWRSISNTSPTSFPTQLAG